MPEKYENALKHQYPPTKISPPGRSVNRPNSFTRADFISSTTRSRDTPRTPVLDLSKEFSPSPELSSQYSSTYFPPSNRVNLNVRYQNIPQPPPPTSGVLSPNPNPPATGSPYVPDSPTSSKYPPAPMTTHSDHMASIQRQLSPTPSGPPDYRSTYSSQMESQVPFAMTNNSTTGDNQYTSYQPPTGSSLPPTQTQIAPLSTSRESTGSLQFRYLPNGSNANQSSSSPKRKSYERRRDSSLSLAGHSGLPNSSPSTSTANGIRQPPPSPTVTYSGSRLSKIPPLSPIIQLTNQTNRPDNEGILGRSEDYRRKELPSVPQENFVFPPGRSAAHPEKPSKPKSPKNSIHSSKSNDESSGRLKIISKIFKKNKGKNTPPDRQISEESSYDFISRHEQTSALKSSYPLDPYNSVLLDNDRHTGELLSLLNRTGSPSFHDYVTPPSSVLDLGCGQGHWVLEAAIAWEAYGTHVIGFDMVDITSSLLPWAAEGVRDNIRFVKGNFLNEQLPFSNDTFDLVRMSCLALCITSDSWGYILREVCRVLVPGGRLEFIDDQMFLPYGKEPLFTEGHDNGSDHNGGGVVHDRKGKGREKLKPSTVLSPEDWDLSISDLETLFERMLLEAFDIYKDPSDIVLPLMSKIFGHAQEVVTMDLVLAPPDSSGRSPRHHCPGLILWPSNFIPMDHTQVEIHASKHLRTLLSCKSYLAQHAIMVAELDGERVDEEFVSQALYKYESFLRHRFNPLIPASGSPVMPDELIHVRTFRVFEAVKGRKAGFNL